MALPTGQITAAQVNTELGRTSSQNINFDDIDLRGLARAGGTGVGSSGTVISMDNLRGKSHVNIVISQSIPNFDLKLAVDRKLPKRIIYNPNAGNVIGTDDYFALTISANSGLFVVTAPYEDGATTTNSGAAYVYSSSTGIQQFSIFPPTSQQSAQFGGACAISPSYIAISAPYAPFTNGISSGEVYIYNRSGTYLRTIVNPNSYSTTDYDDFGYVIAMNDTYIAVSATNEDDATGNSAGAVYVFNISTGSLVYTLANPGLVSPSTADLFGISLSIYGNYLVVGCPYEEQPSTNATNSGYVRVYDITNGAQLYTIYNPNTYSTADDDSFGITLATNSSYLAIGAFEDTATTSNGVVYLYNITNGTLLYTFNNPNPNTTSSADGFGVSSIAMSNSYIAISAPYEYDSLTTSPFLNSGSVYLYDVNTRNLIKTIINPNIGRISTSSAAVTGDYFGFRLAIDETTSTIMMSSYFESNHASNYNGRAYLYNINDENINYVAGTSSIVVTIQPGVFVGSLVVPSAMNANDSVTIKNNGWIIGKGGPGGYGTGSSGSNGNTGGTALTVQRPVTLYNYNVISGGGGGGGAAASSGYGTVPRPSRSGGPYPSPIAGSGGGGGAGFDDLVHGLNLNQVYVAGSGGSGYVRGYTGYYTAGGSGGSYTSPGGIVSTGGSGGNIATAGTAGTTTPMGTGGSGGAAGLSVSGNPFITWGATGTLNGGTS